MIYTFVTYFLCITIVLMPKFSNKSRMLFICSIFAVFSSLRYDFGYDYFNYLDIIVNQEFERFEPFQYYISYLSSIIHPQLFFITNSIVVVVCIYCIYSNVSKKCYVMLVGYVLIFFLPIGFHLSVDRIRQFTSIFLLLYATTLEGRKAKCFYCFLAVMSHYATIVFVPLIVFYKLVSKPLNVFLQIIVLLFLFIFLRDIIFLFEPYLGRYAVYLYNYTSTDGNKILMLYIILWFFCLVNYKYIIINNYILYIYNIFFIGICLYSGLSSFGVHVTRITAFLFLPVPILIGYILGFKSLLYQYIALFLSVFVLIILHYLSAQNINRDFLNNYDFFFLHDLSIVRD